eukprot:353991-Chlamydomonas_euryale.AAC.6
MPAHECNVGKNALKPMATKARMAPCRQAFELVCDGSGHGASGQGLALTRHGLALEHMIY